MPPSSAFDWDDDDDNDSLASTRRSARLTRRVKKAHRRLGLGERVRTSRLAADIFHLAVCMVPMSIVASGLSQGTLL